MGAEPSPWGPERTEVELEARRFAVQQKVSRRALEDATFHQGQTGDDFVRNQLTQMMEATVYSERVDTACIHGELQVEYDQERAREWPVWAAVLLAYSAGIIAAHSDLFPGALIVAALVVAARLMYDRWAIVADTVTTTVPVTADRITWAAYPDAPIPARQRLGQAYRHVEWGPAYYRTGEDD